MERESNSQATSSEISTRLRQLPSVDALLNSAGGEELIERYGRDLTLEGLRRALDFARYAIAKESQQQFEIVDLVASADRWIKDLISPTLRPVVNATGVIIHTNLGRAPLSEATRRAMEAAARGYTNLEYDLESGGRGTRYRHAEDMLLRHFKVHSLKGFGCENAPLGLRAAGAVLYYVNTELRRNLAHVRRIQVKNPDDYLLLDETTVMNLELIAPLNPARQGPKATLLKVLDSTRTAMGARMLRDWIVRPLSNLAAINARLDAVEAFTTNRMLLNDVRNVLGDLRDLERMMSRLGSGGGNARDLRAVGESLDQLPALKELLASGKKFQGLEKSIELLPNLGKMIDEAIDDEPAVSTKEGGMIRKGFSADLDELRARASSGWPSFRWRSRSGPALSR